MTGDVHPGAFPEPDDALPLEDIGVGAGSGPDSGSIGAGRDDAVGDGHVNNRVYDWFVRGRQLLADGSPAAACVVLERAHAHEPRSRSVLELLARAQFDAGRHPDAARSFGRLVDLAPDDDYARFGLGMAHWRMGEFDKAAESLSLAVVMRPTVSAYSRSLQQVRATLRARAAAGQDSPDAIRPDLTPRRVVGPDTGHDGDIGEAP